MTVRNSNKADAPSAAPAEQEQQGEQQRPKRRRIGYACEICRAKKHRCDGERPTCGSCLTRHLQCVYSLQKSRASVSQEYVDNLQANVLLLQRQLAAQSTGHAYFLSLFPGNGGQCGPSTVATEAPRQVVPDETSEQPTSFPLETASQLTTAVSDPTPFTRRHLSAENLRADQQFSDSPIGSSRHHVEPNSPEEGRVASVDPQDKSYFGESSTFDFMTKLGSPQEDTTEEPSVAAAQPHGSGPVAALSLAMSSPSAPIFEGLVLGSGTDDPFGLPNRSAADRLVDIYFKFRHPLNSYLHEGTFRRRYARLWQSKDLGGEEATENNLAWFGLVNLIFAFGSDQTYTPVSGRASIDRIRFFKRAKSLVFSSLLQAGSIELVQALLLIGQYLHGSLELNSCWTVVGLAIRMAQGLGLHLEADTFTSDVIEQEVRKRVWWSCFIIDRVLSMKVGRPPTIHDGPGIKVGMPLAIDDEYLDNSELPVQPPEIPSKLDFINQVIPQCRLLERICETLYSEGQDNSKQRLTDLPKLLALSIQLDGDLVTWQQTLPAHLKAESQELASHFELQRNTLLMRFLNSRLLLHRQILLFFVTRTRRITDSFQREITYCCVRRCIMAAYDTITHICLLHQRRKLQSWWHKSHCVFAALGVVLAFQTLEPQSKEEVALPAAVDVDKVILQGRALLEEVGSHLHPLATRYLQSLQRLESRLRCLSASRTRGGAPNSKINPLDTPAVDIQGPSLENNNNNVFPATGGEDTFGDWNGGAESMIFDEDFLEIENMFNTGWGGIIDDFET